MQVEESRAEQVAKSESKVSNPLAPDPKKRRIQKTQATPPRSTKGFRVRLDYQEKFDALVAREKHATGLKGPDLIEEALSMLFKKYGK